MFRQFHTRKNSRINCNRDLFQRLLASSDPFISSLTKLSTRKKIAFSDEIKQLLDENEDLTDPESDNEKL